MALWALGHRLPEAASDYRAYIGKLHPIRVYEDHGNVVVVQGKTGGIEYGKYIVSVLSSYIPYAGEDGFSLVPAGHIQGDHDAVAEVFDFRRGQPGGAANRSQPVQAETNRTSAAAGSGR